MKWRLFSDKLPPNIEECHMRYADGHAKLVYDYYYWMGEEGKCAVEYDHKKDVTPAPPDAKWIHFGQWGAGGRHEFHQIEWLDESEDITDWGPRLFTQKEVDLLLAEQHRNTRHDAIDVVQDAINDAAMGGDDYWTSRTEQAIRDIMNLKQRKPNGSTS